MPIRTPRREPSWATSYDALVADCVSDPRQRLKLFAQALGVFREDVPAVPLLTLPDLYAVRVGLEWEPPSHRYLRVEDVRPGGS